MGSNTKHFVNDQGVPEIKIGTKTFMCTGASPPHDHPHVFLDMGNEEQKVCPYCSTTFVYKKGVKESEPKGCMLKS